MSENAKDLDDDVPRRPRGRPRAEDLHALEARLIEVARRCFIANGYGATSMAEVARAARVSKTTLYSRFPSKADLFRAIIDAQIQDTDGDLAIRGPKPRTLESMLRGYAEHVLMASLRDEILQLNRLIYAEAGRFPELGEAAWERGQVGVEQVSRQIRQYALLEGAPCRDPDHVADMFIATLRGWYSGLMLRPDRVSAAEVKAWTRKTIAALLAGRAEW
jgi:AcrR family transcriptional regulator